MATAAAGIAAGGLEAAAGLAASHVPPGRALATAAAARWADINRPIALYDLAGTDFSKLPATYRARRRSPDGAREDLMSFGRLGGAKPYLQVSLLRVGEDPAVAASDEGLADGLAKLARARGLRVTRIRAAAAVDTRLGRIEAADLLLWDGAVAVPCLGFRGAANGGSVLRLAGFACGTRERPMDRAALACVIDRIDLASAGDDTALRAVFVAAERRRGSSCLGGAATTSVGPLLAGGRHIGWLDPDGAMPPLRGLFGASNRQR